MPFLLLAHASALPYSLLLFLQPQSFGLDMSTVHHHVGPHPPQPEWHVYGFDHDAKPLLVFSTEPVLHFPGGKQLDLKAKSNKSWDAQAWEAFHHVSADTPSPWQNTKREQEKTTLIVPF